MADDRLALGLDNAGVRGRLDNVADGLRPEARPGAGRVAVGLRYFRIPFLDDQAVGAHCAGIVLIIAAKGGDWKRRRTDWRAAHVRRSGDGDGPVGAGEEFGGMRVGDCGGRGFFLGRPRSVLSGQFWPVIFHARCFRQNCALHGRARELRSGGQAEGRLKAWAAESVRKPRHHTPSGRVSRVMISGVPLPSAQGNPARQVSSAPRGSSRCPSRLSSRGGPPVWRSQTGFRVLQAVKRPEVEPDFDAAIFVRMDFLALGTCDQRHLRALDLRALGRAWRGFGHGIELPFRPFTQTTSLSSHHRRTLPPFASRPPCMEFQPVRLDGFGPFSWNKSIGPPPCVA